MGIPASYLTLGIPASLPTPCCTSPLHRVLTVARQCTRRRPWAQFFRPSLGEGLFDTQVSFNLLQFVSHDPSSFPDGPRSITDRSDGRRAT